MRMLKLYSQLIGLPVIVRGSSRKLARVFHLVLDPDRGQVVALVTARGKVISPMDLAPFHGEKWEVVQEDVFLDEEELVRLKTIEPKRRWLVGKRVVDQSGNDLGVVNDLILEMNTLSLHQLVAGKSHWMSLGREKRLISSKDIVQVTEKMIVVRDTVAESKETQQDYLSVKAGLKAPAMS